MCLSSGVWLQGSVQRSQLHPCLGKALNTLASGLALLKDRVGLSLLEPFQCQCVVCGSTKEADRLCTGELSVSPGPCTGLETCSKKEMAALPTASPHLLLLYHHPETSGDRSVQDSLHTTGIHMTCSGPEPCPFSYLKTVPGRLRREAGNLPLNTLGCETDISLLYIPKAFLCVCMYWWW